MESPLPPRSELACYLIHVEGWTKKENALEFLAFQVFLENRTKLKQDDVQIIIMSIKQSKYTPWQVVWQLNAWALE